MAYGKKKAGKKMMKKGSKMMKGSMKKKGMMKRKRK
jgi:hypothetical protein